MNKNQYNTQFYKIQQAGSRRSADAVVPHLLQLINPRSVLDIGCGVGTWLASFKQSGVTDVVGIDGDYVDRSLLQIPASEFLNHDVTKKIDLGRRFDLAISLEVGEHIPSTDSRILVESLVNHAPVVAFSAAIPEQCGTDHINEQWPEYWASIFRSFNYTPIDCLRARLWHDPQIEYFYAQNTILYVDSSKLDHYPAFKELDLKKEAPIQGMVHPRKWAEAHDPRRYGIRDIAHFLPHALANSIRSLSNRDRV